MIENSLFWQFSTSENPIPSSIYGTIHLGTDQCFAHWQRVSDEIDKYDVIFTESSLDTNDVQSIRQHTLLNEDQSYSDFIKERRWQKMREVFLKYCDIDIEEMASRGKATTESTVRRIGTGLNLFFFLVIIAIGLMAWGGLKKVISK